MGIGEYVKNANAAHAARKQDRQTAAGIAQQQSRQQQANSRVNTQLDSVSAANPEVLRRATADQYLGAIRNPVTSGGQVGAVSGAYRDRVAQTDKRVGDTSSQLADVFSRIDSAGTQRRNEAQGYGRAGADIGVTQNLASGDAYINNLKVKGIKPNPWIDVLGNGISSAENMFAGNIGKPKLADYGSITPKNPGSIIWNDRSAYGANA